MQAEGSVSISRGQPDLIRWSELMMVALGLCLSLLIQLPVGVSGHGYLIDPPSRSSAWRANIPNPVNYNDNELYCGGFDRQWGQNGGKCGVCGDPWDVPPPRPNEIGGMYANGIIVRSYSAGQVVEMNVIVTAPHGGWFEFRLCPVAESIAAPTTQECLDANLLEVKDGISKTRYKLESLTTKGTIIVKVQLPEGLACSRCVLQWKWRVGNSWRVDSDGNGCLGCGPQEEFVNCADISIVSPNVIGNPPKTSPKIATTTPRKISTATTTTKRPSGPTPKVCRATGPWTGDAGMDRWCVTNCAVNNCPSTHCRCVGGSRK